MKKLLSLFLALTLVASMGTTAFAAENEDQTGVGTGEYNADVKATCIEGSNGGTKFSMDIVWSGLTFTYNEDSKNWNTAKHDYDIIPGGWGKSDGAITVTNHSNESIEVIPVWNPGDGYSDVTMSYADGNGDAITSLSLDSAEITGGAVAGTIKVTPGGTLASTASGNNIGTITVKIVGWATVSSESDMAAALAAGRNIRLGSDVNLEDIPPDELPTFTTTSILDLNGHDLLGSDMGAICVEGNGSLTICGDGSIMGCGRNLAYDVDVNSATLIVKSGTIGYVSLTTSTGIVSGSFIKELYLSQSNVTISGGSIGKLSFSYQSSVAISGGSIENIIPTTSNMIISGGYVGFLKYSSASTVTITGGSFGFDPTQYVDTNSYNVTKDETNNTWTVTAKTE